MIHISEIIQGLFVLSAAWLSGRFIVRKERIKSSRLIFERSYSKVFRLIEYDLYSKSIELKIVKYYGAKIIQILDNSNMYYYPSLKVYAERLRDADEEDFQELWAYFSHRYDIEYDRVCKIIKIPIRTRVYRLSRKHYENSRHFSTIYFFSGREAVIDLVSLVCTLTFLILLLVS